jgi:hypothetical protein
MQNQMTEKLFDTAEDEDTHLYPNNLDQPPGVRTDPVQDGNDDKPLAKEWASLIAKHLKGHMMDILDELWCDGDAGDEYYDEEAEMLLSHGLPNSDFSTDARIPDAFDDAMAEIKEAISDKLDEIANREA